MSDLGELSIKSERLHLDIDSLKKYIKILISAENKLFIKCENIKDELVRILLQVNENRNNFKNIKVNLLS